MTPTSGGVAVVVTAEMLDGVVYVPGEVMSLDGPLLWAATVERLGTRYGTPPPDDVAAEQTSEPDPGVPLRVYRAGGEWVYMSSAAEFIGDHGADVVHWHKRLDDGLLVPMVQDGAVAMGRRGKVPVNSGPYKAYRMPLWVQTVERLRWHAVTSDPERLKAILCERVLHIGRRRNTGYGAVMAWSVEERDGATDAWMWRDDGRPARPIPVAMMPDYDGPTEHLPVRPPYRLLQHHRECVAMATEITERAIP